MNQSASPREAKKTPSDLKWLLNERAAIAGAIEKVTTQCQHWDQKLAKAERQYQKAVEEHKNAVSPLRRELGRNQAVLQALDKTISLAYNNVRCDAGGVVSAWAGKYGQLGALTQFVQHTLSQVAPESLSVTNLIDACVLQFNLKHPTPGDRRKLKCTLNGMLPRLQKRGLVEKVTALGPGYPSYWRAVNRFGAVSLRRQAAKALEGASHDLPDPA